MARIGMNSIKKRRELAHATYAISCLHDGLLGVAKGLITVEELKEFFCFDDQSEFIGGVLEFPDKKIPKQEPPSLLSRYQKALMLIAGRKNADGEKLSPVCMANIAANALKGE